MKQSLSHRGLSFSSPPLSVPFFLPRIFFFFLLRSRVRWYLHLSRPTFGIFFVSPMCLVGPPVPLVCLALTLNARVVATSLPPPPLFCVLKSFLYGRPNPFFFPGFAFSPRPSAWETVLLQTSAFSLSPLFPHRQVFSRWLLSRFPL